MIRKQCFDNELFSSVNKSVNGMTGNWSWNEFRLEIIYNR